MHFMYYMFQTYRLGQSKSMVNLNVYILCNICVYDCFLEKSLFFEQYRPSYNFFNVRDDSFNDSAGGIMKNTRTAKEANIVHQGKTTVDKAEVEVDS